MTPASINDNAAYCAELVRTHDFARYASVLFLPPPFRRPAMALYAFNVELGRIRDQITQPLPGEVRLQWWRDLIETEARGSAEANPVAAELLEAIARHDLPRAQLARLVDARVFDLYDDPMPSLDALKRYCDDTSSRLFALTARILGDASDEAEHAAHHAGIAQGLADVLARFGQHSSRRQLYLPNDVLKESEVDEADIFAGRAMPALLLALDRLTGEAQAQLDNAMDLLSSVHEGAPRAFLPLVLVQRQLHLAGDPFAPKSLSHLRVLWTLWRASKSRVFKA